MHVALSNVQDAIKEHKRDPDECNHIYEYASDGAHVECRVRSCFQTSCSESEIDACKIQGEDIQGKQDGYLYKSSYSAMHMLIFQNEPGLISKQQLDWVTDVDDKEGAQWENDNGQV